MALNGYILANDVTFTWDGVSVRLARGTVLDTPASSGSNLAATIGTAGGTLVALTANQQAAMNGVNVGPFMENLTGGGNEPSHYQN